MSLLVISTDVTTLAKDTNSTRYLANTGVSNDPKWDQVNLSNGVAGVLPVANGGTGASTLTANSVLLGNGTSVPQVVAPGSNGNVLTSDGTTWTSAAAASYTPEADPAWAYVMETF